MNVHNMVAAFRVSNWRVEGPSWMERGKGRSQASSEMAGIERTLEAETSTEIRVPITIPS